MTRSFPADTTSRIYIAPLVICIIAFATTEIWLRAAVFAVLVVFVIGCGAFLASMVGYVAWRVGEFLYRGVRFGVWIAA